MKISNKKLRKESKRNARVIIKGVLPISIILTLFLSILVFGPFRITPSDTYILGAFKVVGSMVNYKNTDKVIKKIEDRKIKIQEKFSYGEFSNDGMISDAYHITLRDGTSITLLLANTVATRILKKDKNSSIALLFAILLFLSFVSLIVFPVSVGVKRFFLERTILQNNKFKISRYLGYSFKSHHYFNICYVCFYKNLILFLSLLTIFLFPIKYYQYYQVPYLLSLNPKMKRRDVIRESKRLMMNRKFGAFILDLTFVPLRILSIFTFNILNIVYVDPYYNMTKSEYLYELYDRNITLEESVVEIDEFEIDYKKKKMYSVENLILSFFCFSFIGYIWEVFFIYFKMDLLVNRGSLYGPYIPIYGFAGVLVLILFSKLRNHPIKVFLLSILVCGVIEYSSAVFCEKVFGEVFWDYRGYFLNIDGKVSLEGLLLFGTLCMFAVYIVGPLFNHFLKGFSVNLRRNVAIILIVIIVVDFVFSIIYPRSGLGISN